MIALSPIFILSAAIIILLFLLFYFKLDAKKCMIFTLSSLFLTLIVSAFIGYQISINAKTITDINNDNMQVMATESAATKGKPAQEGQLEQKKIDTASTDNSSLVKKNINNAVAEKVNANNNVTIEAEINEAIKNSNNESSGENLSDTITTDNQSNDNKIVNSEKANDGESGDLQASYITSLFTSDGYGLLYISLILIISIVVSCFVYEWFKQEITHHGLFYIILLFTTLGGVTLVYASHLLSLFVGIELLSISFVGLIGYQYMQTHSLEAAIKYMVLSSVASAFLLMGIAFYYAATGELTFSGLSYKFSTQAYPSTLLSMGACLMLIGIGFKVSLVPFQLWLPDVYQGTPTSVLLMFSTVGKVAVFCAIAKLFLFAPIVNNDTLHAILVMMSFFSILWGNFLALRQKNIKRLLAYSSIAEFGYLMTALIAVQYQVLALETIGVYLIGYMLANISLLGGISLESHSNEQQDHETDIDLCGLFWRRPLLAISMTISLLSLAGVPLTAGFIARFLLVLLGVTAELWWIIIAIVIGSALGLYFYAKLIIQLYTRLSNKEEQVIIAKTSEMKLSNINASEMIIVGAAFLTLLCGIYPKWVFNLVSMAQYLTS